MVAGEFVSAGAIPSVAATGGVELVLVAVVVSVGWGAGVNAAAAGVTLPVLVCALAASKLASPASRMMGMIFFMARLGSCF